uniref:Glycosyltransferase n=1 Tax=Kalanchoe fedtschenkoi TaxID=63787 RepID=A0A7N0TF06_KALFE
MGVENKRFINRTRRMEKLIILVPYPAQGHVTPMVKLGRAIHTHGFQPLLITPASIHAKICDNDRKEEHHGPADPVAYVPVPDIRGGAGMQSDFFGIEKVMENEMPQHLDRIIRQLEEGGGMVVCLVVDLLASWAIEVGKRRDILVAGFWPAMFATYGLFGDIPDMVQSGFISQSGLPVEEGATRSLPEQPLMINAQELPWMIGDLTCRQARFQFWIRILHRSASLSCLLVNSFSGEARCWDDEDPQNAMGRNILLNTSSKTLLPHQILIPPTLLLVGALNMQAQADTTPSFWDQDDGCLRWLDKQRSSSVLYISFGSWVSPISEAQTKSLASALEATMQPFLWVLGSNWRHGLPEGFINRVSNQGKLVFWAPQTQVLQHEAVGCFLSHCGWNSTIEAIQFQKKLLCYPIAGDQFINCKFVVDVWKIGMRVHCFQQKDLEEGIQMVTGNDEMGSRLAKLKEIFMGRKAISGAANSLAVFIRHIQNRHKHL